jgi:hypothetical protein
MRSKWASNAASKAAEPLDQAQRAGARGPAQLRRDTDAGLRFDRGQAKADAIVRGAADGVRGRQARVDERDQREMVAGKVAHQLPKLPIGGEMADPALVGTLPPQ